MNHEFQAYVRAIAGAECGKSKAAQSSGLLRSLKKRFLAFVRLLESIGPYYCELRPMRRVRGAIEQCCKTKEAIGFHGLA